MEVLSSANMPSKKPNPVFPEQVNESLFEEMANDSCASMAKAADMAFNQVHHSSASEASSWTVFNEKHTSTDPPITTVGYMPIIQAPAHEYDTLYMTVNRCMQVSAHLGQEYIWY